MPLSGTPAFKPAQAPIQLGAAGTVLTSNGPTSAPTFQAAGGSGFGSFLAFASPAGASNDVTPAGFDSTIGLLNVTLVGDANWTGLVAGADKQPLVIRNDPANANTLTLNNANAASAAANQFSARGDFILLPGTAILLVYYTTPAKWILVP